jgi:16S rRNA (cytidine1402-2'-O)-methyltransferase
MPLIVCGTPIGNLDDAAPRLVEALCSCDVVFAEDTRRTRVMLDRFGVDVPLRSFFAGNEEKRAGELEERLRAGETVGLVTDAGMPSISDPGLTAVGAARAAGADITVIPGPSAVTAALAVSGLPSERFVFEGFLPRSGSERSRRLGEIAEETRTVVFFASPRRVGGDLRALADRADDRRVVCVARELTKLHEELWWGTLSEAAEHFTGDQRGEFTVVMSGASPRPPDLQSALKQVHTLVGEGESMSAAVRIAAERSGVPRRILYEMVLKEA